MILPSDYYRECCIATQTVLDPRFTPSAEYRVLFDLIRYAVLAAKGRR